MDVVDILILVGAALLVPLSALLAVTDTVLTHVTRARAVALADDARRNAGLLLNLLERREEALHAVLLLGTACNVIAPLLVGVVSFGVGGWSAALTGLVVSLVVIHLGAVAVPRSWAQHNLDRAVGVAAPVARGVWRVWPVRIGALVTFRLARRLFPREERPEILELGDESFLAVAGSPLETDALDVGDQDLLSSVIAFGQTVVREIMVPRPDMVTLAAAMPLGDAVEVAMEEGYSRFPVIGEGVDDVVGVVYARDLVAAALKGDRQSTVGDLANPARFVPETKPVADLLRELQQEKLHLAVVVDEYGGIAGLVSLEDIIEELVGEIADEFDEELPPIEELDDGRVRVDAALPVDEANDRLHLDLPEGDWDTIGGLVFDHFGYVPTPGEVADIGGQRIVVEQVVGRRIRTVVLLPEAPAAAEVGA